MNYPVKIGEKWITCGQHESTRMGSALDNAVDDLVNELELRHKGYAVHIVVHGLESHGED